MNGLRSLGKPIVTLIDTPGHFPGLKAEGKRPRGGNCRNLKGNVYAQRTGDLYYYRRRCIRWSLGYCNRRSSYSLLENTVVSSDPLRILALPIPLGDLGDFNRSKQPKL